MRFLYKFIDFFDLKSYYFFPPLQHQDIGKVALHFAVT